MRALPVALLTLLLVASSSLAQSAEATRRAPRSVEPDSVQVAAAVLPLPEEFRAGATVLGYRTPDGPLEILRRGDGAFTCLATDPKLERFHVACYHGTLEPFMARGRALRARGMDRERVDSVRMAEMRSGSLRMPVAAALYSLTGGAFDPASGSAPGARALFVIYTPGATPESLGISARPKEGAPWLMFPGQPNAHIMFVPRM